MRNILLKVNNKDNVSVCQLKKDSFIGVVTKEGIPHYILQPTKDKFILAEYCTVNLSSHIKFDSIESCLNLSNVVKAYEFEKEIDLFHWLNSELCK